MIVEQREVDVKHFFYIFFSTRFYLNQCHEVLGTRQQWYVDV